MIKMCVSRPRLGNSEDPQTWITKNGDSVLILIRFSKFWYHCNQGVILHISGVSFLKFEISSFKAHP